jgi:hypothetical protein
MISISLFERFASDENKSFVKIVLMASSPSESYKLRDIIH